MARKVYSGVQNLAKVDFSPDFLPPPSASLITSRISSAFKRHGKVLEEALSTALSCLPNVEARANLRCKIGVVKDIDVVVRDNNQNKAWLLELKRTISQLDGGALQRLSQRLDAMADDGNGLPFLRGFMGKIECQALTRYGPQIEFGASYISVSLSEFAASFDQEVSDFLDEVDEYFQFCLCRELESQASKVARDVETVLTRDRSDVHAGRRELVRFEPVEARFVGKEGGRPHPWDSFV
jgi:hypothetical protein